MWLELGNQVRCTDGPVGELADVLIDPISRLVSHLVVQPGRNHALARLVPISLAHAQNGTIALTCTSAEVHDMAPAQEFAYVRFGEPLLDDPDWDVGIETVLAPYAPPGLESVITDPRVAVTFDRVPRGEVEIRRKSDVMSSDHHRLGRVDGFFVDAGEHITHLVLERGHLWSRRDVKIPIDAVERVETDSISLSLTRDEIDALISAAVRRRGLGSVVGAPGLAEDDHALAGEYGRDVFRGDQSASSPHPRSADDKL